ncbi:AraC family transcriptional regulator [Glutamicibacter sp. MNS18]|uniref:helix-turn-helix domain-containing protein n=1 Tax=Glutamicibacter sp. MNS18 TaxID=2989817 RepID=UPI002235446B|nr:AraC family transcriptional regulator [Glutamicibacter sp. MNS18]MCW4464108.1 AraC family transcriptional regulator [Glutamicibacter sp. MNS18]
MESGVDHRSLPVFEAGSVEVPFAIYHFQEKVSRETRWSAHSHPTHELLWNDRGASQVTVGDKTWTISRNTGVWMPAGMLHSGMAPADSWCNSTHFGFHAVTSISDTPVAVEVDELLRLLLKRLAAPGLSEKSRRITEAAVVDNLAPATHEVILQIPHGDLLRPLVQALTKDPGDQRTLADWAAELNVSSRTVTRAFQTETGVGFSAWLGMLRLQWAITQLSCGEDTEWIAEKLGYRSLSAFGAAFKRGTGSTPSAFRP